jgi:undecaprenyl-diphosphatase
MRAILHQFDYRVTALIQQWPDWVRPIMLFGTFVGQPIFTVGIGALVAGIGWGRSNIRLLLSGVTVAATFGLGSLLKLLLRRDRPITEYVANMRFDTFSLPSGHAIGGVVAYGLIAYLLWQILPQPYGWIAVGAFTALAIIIGLSRIYLGAHYPSDVFVGWLIGLAGLAFIIFVIQPKL